MEYEVVDKVEFKPRDWPELGPGSLQLIQLVPLHLSCLLSDFIPSFCSPSTHRPARDRPGPVFLLLTTTRHTISPRPLRPHVNGAEQSLAIVSSSAAGLSAH